MSLLDLNHIVEWFQFPFYLLDNFKILDGSLAGNSFTVSALDVLFYLMIINLIISVFIKAGDWRVGI